MRNWIFVEKNNNTPIAIAPDFTQEELHGFKQDIRNKVPDSHTIDSLVVAGVQAVRAWTRLVFPELPDGVAVKITSTARTSVFNEAISTSGAKGAHVYRIAIDWKFVGDNALEATKKFNTDIRDRGPLYQRLREIGINGIGLYGPASSFGSNFCHMDTRGEDTPNLVKRTPDEDYGNWAFWQKGGPLFSDSVEEVELEDDEPQLPPPSDCVQDLSVNEGLSTGQEIFLKDKVGESSAFFISDVTDKDLLDYKHEDLTNRKRLFNTLSFEDKVKYSGNSDGSYNSTKDYPLEVGAVLYFPCEWIKMTKNKGGESTSNTDPVPGNDEDTSRSNGKVEVGATMTQSHTNESIPYPPMYSLITQDPGFKPASLDRDSQFSDIYPQLTVYGWSRALDKSGISSILDLTMDVISITTNSSMEGGGNFVIEMAPVFAEHNGAFWVKKGAVSRSDSGLSINLSSINEQVTRITSEVTNDGEGAELSESRYDTYTSMYYERIFQANDAIFIKFENLSIDQTANQRREGILADQWYDMMALVDTVAVNRNAQGTAVSVTIRGRDYQKALVDESGYTNPYSIGGVASMFGSQANVVSPRSFDGGIFKYRTVELLTLNKVLEFSMYALISNEFVPSKVFENNWAWEDRNHIYTHVERTHEGEFIYEVGLDETEERKYGLRGIWQKIRFWIDPQISEYVVYDDSISQPEGSIWQHFMKVCQKPYVEVFTETVGDWFYIIVRRPPFTKISYDRLLSSTNQTSTSLGADESQNKYRQYKDALNRIKKGDPINSQATQSYINNYGRVEFIEDYLADISEEQLNEFRSLNYQEQLKEIQAMQTQQGFNNYNTFPAIVNIHPRDILSDSLQFCTDVYTWYEIDTRGLYQSTGGPFGMPLPAVYFQELAQVYGSKRLSISTNYIDVHSVRDGGEDARKKQDLIEEEIAQLLGYIIETHIYLPFTREGTITLANGDRRIKKGMFIYHQGTDEVFYVKGVTHQLRHANTSIHRTTTIQVERGMVVPYIWGREESVINDEGEVSEEVVSYFNIVDIPKIQEQALDAVNSVSNLDVYDQKKPATVNQGALNFFLAKKQFKK